jgi:hypothetical protein
VTPWRGDRGGDFVVLARQDRHPSRWGSLSQSQVMPAQPAAWADRPIWVGVGAALIAALVTWAWCL